MLVMATSLVPFALVGYAVAALGWWAVRRLSGAGRVKRTAALAAVVSVLGVGVHAGLLVPSYAGSHASAHPDLTVMTSNLRLGLGDTRTVARLAVDQHADIVVLEEVTPASAVPLGGLRAEYPYVAGRPAPGAFGTIVLSRYPLEQASQLPVSKGAWQMRVAAPRPFWLVAVHTSQPLTSYAAWRTDHDNLAAAVGLLGGPLVVAGDFNATLDHRPMRRLLHTGLADAARESNAGWQATWPVSQRLGRLVPFGLGMMALDHVLVSREFVAISTSTFPVLDSDHLALVARLARS
jgi:endonuclease/exonuclease/phosphatase (EEP) superfamily protein YafD